MGGGESGPLVEPLESFDPVLLINQGKEEGSPSSGIEESDCFDREC